MELIPEDIDRISPELELASNRYPTLAKTGIKRWINGAFTFTPDGNPLVGPVGPRVYWVACGVMAGFSQGGGVGKALAEWMIHGQAEQDVFGMDVGRYGNFHSNREVLRQTTAQFYARRFVMTFPNEQLPAARPLKTTASHQEMTDVGCLWGSSWGLEIPLYFAPSPEFEEPGTLLRTTAFPVIAAETRAVQDAAGLLDISGFARYEISGPNAAAWLEHLLPCTLPRPGRARLAPMLAGDGRLKGDLTLFSPGDGTWWLTGSYCLRSYHMRWFAEHAQVGPTVTDISDQMQGFSLQGPKSREILERVAGLVTLTMMGWAAMDVGLVRTKVGRLSLSGEMVYEINRAVAYHATLRRTLLAAGADLGLKEIGFLSLQSMRPEKFSRIWSGDFCASCTPGMTGLGRWVAADKPDFIGRDAYLAAAPSATKMLMLQVDALDADAGGFSPIRHGDRKVGYTTTGGYGHRTGCSLAVIGTDLTLEPT